MDNRAPKTYSDLCYLGSRLHHPIYEPTMIPKHPGHRVLPSRVREEQHLAAAQSTGLLDLTQMSVSDLQLLLSQVGGEGSLGGNSANHLATLANLGNLGASHGLGGGRPANQKVVDSLLQRVTFLNDHFYTV